jgi:hypothetical protein
MRGSSSIVTTRRRMMLPRSRKLPQCTEPTPPDPPAMKPPIVAVAHVRENMRISCPECSLQWASRSLSKMPGSQITRPGCTSFTLSMWRRCMTQPPRIGMACP